MRILYARDRVAVPWKNGGGTTSEVAAHPAGAGFDTFGWRVSIARVERGGPFSIFPGIDRRIGLFEGRMKLAITGQGDVELSSASAPLAFPGDAKTECELIEPVTDLNVMTRRGKFASRMERRILRDVTTLNPAALMFAFPLFAVMVRSGEAEYPLVPGDAIFADAPQDVALSAPTEFFWIEIFPV